MSAFIPGNAKHLNPDMFLIPYPVNMTIQQLFLCIDPTQADSA